MTLISIVWYSTLIIFFVLKKIIMNSVQVKKQALLTEVYFFFKKASVYADEGDLQSCAGLILRALDKQRWAEGLGPQVLYLIIK